MTFKILEPTWLIIHSDQATDCKSKDMIQTDLPILLSNEYRGILCESKGKQPLHEADSIPLRRGEVTNA
jgi:hypothetical protein